MFRFVSFRFVSFPVPVRSFLILESGGGVWLICSHLKEFVFIFMVADDWRVVLFHGNAEVIEWWVAKNKLVRAYCTNTVLLPMTGYAKIRRRRRI